jgi:hypothetical protein
LIYGGSCSGSKDFKTFYFTQKTLKHGAAARVEKETASDEELGEGDGEPIDIVKP